MSNIQYEFISDETVIVNLINGLESLARKELVKNQDIYMEDLYLFAAVDKSLKLIDSFLFALKERNITVLASLTRIQMDCVLRTYATTLVSDSGAFCEKVLLKNVPVSKEVDVNNKHLTDKYLCESLSKILNLPLYELYQKVCGYVHFSSSSFYNIARTAGDNGFSMLIGKQNRSEDEETYTRLSIELANHFYYFGKILITVVIHSWLMQKEEMAEISPNL